MTPGQRLFRIGDLATILDMSVGWIRKQVRLRRFPRGRRVDSRTRVWTENQVNAYLMAVEHGILPILPRKKAREKDESAPRKKGRQAKSTGHGSSPESMEEQN